MRIISWNVNGLWGCVRNEYFDPFIETLPDVICCQETKAREDVTVIDGYNHYYLAANEDRYCGNLIMTLDEPLSLHYGMNAPDYDEDEPRVMTVELPEVTIVNTYMPSVTDKLERRIFRLGWGRAYKEYVQSLKGKKPVILCGDFNASLSELDYYDENRHKRKEEDYGFESDERTQLKELLDLGFTDAYRHLYPTVKNAYTRWPVKGDCRKTNRGARLDYFFVSDDLITNVSDVVHHVGMEGSDHCPIELILGGVR